MGGWMDMILKTSLNPDWNLHSAEGQSEILKWGEGTYGKVQSLIQMNPNKEEHTIWPQEKGKTFSIDSSLEAITNSAGSHHSPIR